jgi:hypothetical protein
MNLGLYQHISPLLVEGPFSLLLVQSHLTKEIKMRGPAKIAGSKMGSKTCPTCKGTGKVPVKIKPKTMSGGKSGSSGSRSGPGGRGGPGDRGGKGKGPGGPGRSRA